MKKTSVYVTGSANHLDTAIVLNAIKRIEASGEFETNTYDMNVENRDKQFFEDIRENVLQAECMVVIITSPRGPSVECAARIGARFGVWEKEMANPCIIYVELIDVKDTPWELHPLRTIKNFYSSTSEIENSISFPSCIVGSIDDAIQKLVEFRTAGIQIGLYGGSS